MRFVITGCFVATLAACSNDSPNTCAVSCVQDIDCLNGQTCGELGRCTDGDLCTAGTCAADSFLGCTDSETARFCNASGDGIASQSCGMVGCNATQGHCNECVAEQTSCKSRDMLDTCGADGLVASTEACALGCLDAVEGGAARCEHITPVWIPSACDAPATQASLDLASTTSLDSDLDATCTGGVIPQPSGPAICVVRYGSIRVGADVSVTGARAIAFVADRELEVSGLLDVSANGSTSGAGHEPISSGSAPTANGGGGGAGFKQVGGFGGGDEFGNGSGVGGAIVDPLGTHFAGGSASTRGSGGTPRPGSGGGGGALLLVSCLATVTVSGTIDAGGGGGGGGTDTSTLIAGTTLVGGAGGGAGGYVVVQAVQVAVTGSLYANGGGGGGGCSTDNCVGARGQDAAAGAAGGVGGLGAGTGTSGGAGGIGTTSPQNGTSDGTSISRGGGGGATGRLQVYVPDGVTPQLTPINVQPPFEPTLVVAVRLSP